jgi:hypothetical protein
VLFIGYPNFGRDAGPLAGDLNDTYAHFIPTMQDQVAQLMDEVLTPIPIELR